MFLKSYIIKLKIFLTEYTTQFMMTMGYYYLKIYEFKRIHERSSINRREIIEHNWFGNLTNLTIVYK